jgi:hypothetical protein
MALAMSMTALSMRLDEEADPEDEWKMSIAQKEVTPCFGTDVEKIEDARKALAAAASCVVATVAETEQATPPSPPVVFAPPAPPPIVVPMKPAITFAHEECALLEHVKLHGLVDYDRDGSADIDAMEFRQVLRDSKMGNHNGESDGYVEAELEKWDKDDSHRLNQQEVQNFLADACGGDSHKHVPNTACSGWTPAMGEDMGHGASCDKWGFVAFWCFIPSCYEGPGASTKVESRVHPGKFIAPCKNPPGWKSTWRKPAPAPDKEEEVTVKLESCEDKMKKASDLLTKTLASVHPDCAEASLGKHVRAREEKEAEKLKVQKLEKDLSAAVANSGVGHPSMEVLETQKTILAEALGMGEVALKMIEDLAMTTARGEEALQACKDAMMMGKTAMMATPAPKGARPPASYMAATAQLKKLTDTCDKVKRKTEGAAEDEREHAIYPKSNDIRCLSVGALSAGNKLETDICSGSKEQMWKFDKGLLKSSSDPLMCLTVEQAVDGSSIQTSACPGPGSYELESSLGKWWCTTTNGKLELYSNRGLCLSAPTKDNDDQSSIKLEPCKTDRAGRTRKWRIPDVVRPAAGYCAAKSVSSLQQIEPEADDDDSHEENDDDSSQQWADDTEDEQLDAGDADGKEADVEAREVEASDAEQEHDADESEEHDAQEEEDNSPWGGQEAEGVSSEMADSQTEKDFISEIEP